MHDRAPNEDLHVLEIDLTHDEARRRAAVLAALGDSWDPIAAMEGEDEAHRLLYSGLDEEQQAIYRQLQEAGVLPPQEGDGNAAD
ncbi:DUF6400 family protein [Streptantibioticus rubrisoli]|uniref:DUF6400 family protein n=1 Tax=Streptantibioticus rubrisoli TaxID=1387313 RepID=A0ABT1PBJ1_9ACTN|nr:DUF6400 family protein [Streptantibioticus rubrisoli]MCQ4041808.1 DUF6400 family protein [Streptantibioticus rubrisoli]